MNVNVGKEWLDLQAAGKTSYTVYKCRYAADLTGEHGMDIVAIFTTKREALELAVTLDTDKQYAAISRDRNLCGTWIR